MDRREERVAASPHRDQALNRLSPLEGTAMEIVLGLDADTYAWPLTTNGAAARAGGMVTGPTGLLRVVQTALSVGSSPTRDAKCCII